MRRIGALIAFPENDPNTQAYVTAFAQALVRLGWIEGKNIRTDYRFAAGDAALFKTYAAELVGLSPDAILASPGTVVVALREQTCLGHWLGHRHGGAAAQSGAVAREANAS